jgi:hypothetical protein
MELIPKMLVAGVFSPTILPGTQNQITPEKINRAWVDLAGRHRYTQLQLSPDGAAANFLGATPQDGITIQPPILQFRSSVRTTVEQAGEDAQDAITAIARHLGAADIQQLGVKVVYWASLPDNDAPGFVLHRVFGRSEEDLAPLGSGGTLLTGAKFIIQHTPAVVGGYSYTLLVEPLLQDPKMLYLDLDAQFPGPADLGNVSGKVREVDQFLKRTVKEFLEGLGPHA